MSETAVSGRCPIVLHIMPGSRRLPFCAGACLNPSHASHRAHDNQHCGCNDLLVYLDMPCLPLLRRATTRIAHDGPGTTWQSTLVTLHLLDLVHLNRAYGFTRQLSRRQCWQIRLWPLAFPAHSFRLHDLPVHASAGSQSMLPVPDHREEVQPRLWGQGRTMDLNEIHITSLL